MIETINTGIDVLQWLAIVWLIVQIRILHKHHIKLATIFMAVGEEMDEVAPNPTARKSFKERLAEVEKKQKEKR